MEKIKIKIEFLKTLLIAFLTAFFAMIAYLVVNLYVLKDMQIFLIFIGITLMLVALIICSVHLKQCFKFLREEK